MYRVFNRVFRLIARLYFRDVSFLKGYEYVYCYFKEMLNISICSLVNIFVNR